MPLPAHPTDHYLPPGMPGYRDTKLLPVPGQNVAKARALAARHAGRTAVLYTCNALAMP